MARPGDVVVALTTSGNSGNVVAGLAAARSRGATTVLLGAGDGGAARVHADHALLVPSDVTARVQEVHALFVHLLSDAIDAWALSTEAKTPDHGPEGDPGR
jgi:D-sedoheptulose 7-phosphate isomerase